MANFSIRSAASCAPSYFRIDSATRTILWLFQHTLHLRAKFPYIDLLFGVRAIDRQHDLARA
jgi:hypothetical protein